VKSELIAVANDFCTQRFRVRSYSHVMCPLTFYRLPEEVDTLALLTWNRQGRMPFAPNDSVSAPILKSMSGERQNVGCPLTFYRLPEEVDALALLTWNRQVVRAPCK